jgi:murein DD-endopeptidase MepM/ murein hydrolase activator NlpD
VIAVKLTRKSGIVLCLTAIVSCTATPPAATTAPAQPPIIKPMAKPPPISAGPVISTLPQYPEQFSILGDPVQGIVLVARAPTSAKSVKLNGIALPIDRDGYFLMGFDRDAENSASLVALLKNGKTVERYLPVRPGNWKIEQVDANPTGGAATTAEFQARRGPELARINAARSGSADVAGWRQKFILPLNGRISGLFGAQRIYRGSPGSYHSGMDIAAVTGTLFVAPADGIVTLAAKEPFTLEGHLLMIDHGMGLNSAFLHCSELLVEEGQLVKQGQVIGKVGMTGRATGPHLHWGMKWNSARVDPKLLVPSF